MLDLVIISGASKGIGLNIAKNLSNISKVIIGIGSSEKICDVKLPNENCKFVALRGNLMEFDRIRDSVRQLVSHINPTSLGIVLCGGSIGEFGGIFKSNLHNWNDLYKCNVLGNLAIIQACEDYIKSAKTRIVFFGGGGAAFAYTDFSGYALSKVAVVRAVENIAVEFSSNNYDSSIIALAPGAVETDIFAKVVAHGGQVRTKTSIEEPTNFVHKFLNDEFDAKQLNGKFVHVRDDLNSTDFSNKDIFQLRRIQ